MEENKGFVRMEEAYMDKESTAKFLRFVIYVWSFIMIMFCDGGLSDWGQAAIIYSVGRGIKIVCKLITLICFS